jgi:hypothetical protein
MMASSMAMIAPPCPMALEKEELVRKQICLLDKGHQLDSSQEHAQGKHEMNIDVLLLI